MINPLEPRQHSHQASQNARYHTHQISQIFGEHEQCSLNFVHAHQISHVKNKKLKNTKHSLSSLFFSFFLFFFLLVSIWPLRNHIFITPQFYYVDVVVPINPRIFFFLKEGLIQDWADSAWLTLTCQQKEILMVG
jgi:hypothetical protein